MFSVCINNNKKHIGPPPRPCIVKSFQKCKKNPITMQDLKQPQSIWILMERGLSHTNRSHKFFLKKIIVLSKRVETKERAISVAFIFLFVWKLFNTYLVFITLSLSAAWLLFVLKFGLTQSQCAKMCISFQKNAQCLRGKKAKWLRVRGKSLGLMSTMTLLIPIIKWSL